jgi:hypothetical protein
MNVEITGIPATLGHVNPPIYLDIELQILSILYGHLTGYRAILLTFLDKERQLSRRDSYLKPAVRREVMVPFEPGTALGVVGFSVSVHNVSAGWGRLGASGFANGNLQSLHGGKTFLRK